MRTGAGWVAWTGAAAKPPPDPPNKLLASDVGMSLVFASAGVGFNCVAAGALSNPPTGPPNRLLASLDTDVFTRAGATTGPERI